MSLTRRNNFLGSIPPVTRIVLLINIAVFLIDPFITHLIKGWLIPADADIDSILRAFLSLYSFHTHAFRPYQLVTHMFLHGNFMHILFNMFGLFMFGRVLESVLGSKRFFILYFLSGLGAAALQLAIYYFKADTAQMMGASGAIFGILAGFAMLFPNVELMIIPIPIPIKAKYVVLGYVAIDLFGGLVSFSGDNIAHFAHLGGAIVGFFLIKFWKKNQFRMY